MKDLECSKVNASLILFFCQQILLSAFYVSGIVLRTGETALKKTDLLLLSQKLTSWWGLIEHREIIKKEVTFKQLQMPAVGM